MFNRQVPQEVSDAMKEFREFNHGKSADVLENYINSLPHEISREEWVEVFKSEALEEPEMGWLSDLSNCGLSWNDSDESIVLDYPGGSVDVAHIVELIQHVLENGIPDEKDGEQ